ncbi:hypothetical protein THARTR1_08930 [Trichoderma harzianum]|uniref:Uncharacterized protein n=1 Tax=Trichoderma harzianum TaxID=5544 RepID=A0A2K0TXZ4_TRIHA|nr:hypothetical protein THARTR1_08930 [Trichoderma harzianum]
MDPRPSPESLDNKPLKDLGPTVIFAAEIAYDFSMCDATTGKIQLNLRDCVNRLEHVESHLGVPDAFEKMPETKQSEMITFHEEVVRPMLGWFLKESKRVDAGEVVPTLEHYYSAFYLYQSACSFLARFQKDDEGWFKGSGIPRIYYGEQGTDFKMLKMIHYKKCGKPEQHALREIVGWARDHYHEVIDKVREARPNDCPEGEHDTLWNFLPVHGLKHLQQNRFLNSLDNETLVKELKEAKFQWEHRAPMFKRSVMSQLEEYTDYIEEP